MAAELEKAGSAEPHFFQILRHICPAFRQIFTKSSQILSNFTKFYKIFKCSPILPNFIKFLPKFN